MKTGSKHTQIKRKYLKPNQKKTPLNSEVIKFTTAVE